MNFPYTVLYKYTNRKFAVQMIDKGEVLINTLENLRNEDKYDLEIGDKGEGTQETYMRGKTISQSNPQSVPPTIKRMISQGKLKLGSGKITIGGSVIEKSGNVYIYSLSTNNQLLPQFIKKTNNYYNTVVEISNVAEFIRLLSGCLYRNDLRIKQCIHRPIEYIKRDQELETQTNIHPIFVKDPSRHKWQKEHRFVWTSLNNNIAPVIIQCPEIKKHLSII